MRRFLEFLTALVLLILLFPLILICSLLIVIVSPGNPIFSQERVGKKKQMFRLYKLRTMKVHKIQDQTNEKTTLNDKDDRIFLLGRLLRKYSIDELPQLINIIIGQMSFIGPRPILIEQLRAIPSLYHPRFDVKPGITGLSQVIGRRNLGWKKQLKFDEFYAVRSTNWSLNCYIILKTFNVVLKAQNIYPTSSDNWRNHIGS